MIRFNHGSFVLEATTFFLGGLNGRQRAKHPKRAAFCWVWLKVQERVTQGLVCGAIYQGVVLAPLILVPQPC